MKYERKGQANEITSNNLLYPSLYNPIYYFLSDYSYIIVLNNSIIRNKFKSNKVKKNLLQNYIKSIQEVLAGIENLLKGRLISAFHLNNKYLFFY